MIDSAIWGGPDLDLMLSLVSYSDNTVAFKQDSSARSEKARNQRFGPCSFCLCETSERFLFLRGTWYVWWNLRTWAPFSRHDVDLLMVRDPNVEVL
jgi:hypothetical protein